MARIVISTIGSRGDLHPFLALAQALRARDHQIVFAVQAEHVSQVEAHKFTARRLSGGMFEQHAPQVARIFTSNSSIASTKTMVEHLWLPSLAAQIDELRAICAGADAFVASNTVLAASTVADLIDTPWISVTLTPTVLPSRFVQPAGPRLIVPQVGQALLNQAQWNLARAALRPIADTPINALRARYNLPPRHDLMLLPGLSSRLTALAVSPAFVPKQPDWPSQVRVTGYCFWDTPSEWQPSPELEAFLDGAQPIIAISSGSMVGGVAQLFDQFFRTSVRAAQDIGARALVIGAAPGALPTPLPADVFAVDYVPFSYVYPRSAAVIHHGGMGTLAQSLRAGVPALIAPWGFDQFFAGDYTQRIGAGRTLPRQRYTQPRVANALHALVHDRSYRERTQAIADRIAHEDGAARLAQAIEDVL